MLYRKLTGTDLEVSALALGTAAFGAGYTEETSLKLLDAFAEGGGNLIDTAHVYSDWIPGTRSRSEKLIGRWLQQTGMRGRVNIITKGAHPPFEDMHASRVNQREIREDLFASLENLRTDRVEFCLLHRDDPSVPAGEIVEWMNELIREGAAAHWGCSNWTAARIAEADAYAAAHQLEGVRMNQTMWSFARINASALSDQTLVPMDDAAYRYHEQTGLSLTAYTSQAKGYFPRLAAGEALPKELTDVYGGEENARRLGFLRKTSDETGLSVAALTLLYFTKQPFPAVPVAAFGSVQRLKAALGAFDDEALARAAAIEFP